MITQAPLADRALLARARRPAGDDSVLTRPWRRPGDVTRLVDRSATALATLARAVKAVRGHAPHVALPAWICAQALAPLRRTGAVFHFLPVRSNDGLIDWDAAEGLGLGALDLVVLVHPFGVPAPIEPARRFAEGHGALLVEDAAHVLMPAPGIGAGGDAVLYSPHKLLPLPEGAVIALAAHATRWAEDFDRALGTPARPSAQDDGDWLLRRRLQAMIPDGLRRLLPQGGQASFTTDPAPQPAPPALVPGDLARRLLAACDLSEEGRRRRINAQALLSVIGRKSGLSPLYTPEQGIPYRLALRAASPALAAEYYGRLRRLRLPVESWPDLPAEVSADPRHAEGAVTLRRTVLLLPVHGCLEPEALALAYREGVR
jgi:hypothetical protein